MKKTPIVISIVLLLLAFFWISFSIKDIMLEDSESLFADEVEATTEAITISTTEAPATSNKVTYQFRYQDLYDEHYEKHGHEFGDISKEAYLKIANDLFNSDEALRKTESDGDLLFYDEASNTFGVLSEDGFIRTCFKPDDGIEYWNRQ